MNKVDNKTLFNPLASQLVIHFLLGVLLGGVQLHINKNFRIWMKKTLYTFTNIRNDTKTKHGKEYACRLQLF